MSTHAKLSPSSAERWFNCSGSLNLIATLPAAAFTTSKYAAEGTVAHGLAEEFVQGKLDLLTLTTRVGETVMQDGHEIEITDAMVEGIIEYVDHIASLRKGMAHKPTGTHGYAEVRVIASSVDEGVFGTTDYLLFQKGDQLHVLDFKYGKGLVEAEENKQGLTYVVGAQDRFLTEKEEGAAGRAFDKIFFHIVQPRVRGGETIKTWQLPPGRVDAFRQELAAAVKATRDPKAARVAGPWCAKTFCPAIAYCPEASSGVQHAVGTVFTRLPAPPSKEVGLMSLPPVTTLTAEQLARVLDWEDTIDHFIEACRERAQAELMRDVNSLPDYKLVEGKSNRVWSSEEVAETAFAMLGEERFTPRKLKSPAQMEKIAGKDEVAKYAVKPAGKLTVVKASDKRQAVNHVSSADAAGVFGALPMSEEAKTQLAVFGSVLTDEKGDVVDDVFGDLARPAPKKEPFWPT